MISIRRIDDLAEAVRLHELAFPCDEWPGDEHTFWIARDGAAVVGFASAVHREDKGHVFLSRAAVVKRAQHCGLHVRLIKHRLMWAQMRGAREAVTYVTLQNYPSLVNLLACGFEFYKPAVPWVGKRVHYLRFILDRA